VSKPVKRKKIKKPPALPKLSPHLRLGNAALSRQAKDGVMPRPKGGKR